ncbi:MAG: hypothetical protein MZV64_70930 [Ignavibacteriales bacterium]|nr:hypothetical protein [Ignavibacteriales bacterium]
MDRRSPPGVTAGTRTRALPEGAVSGPDTCTARSTTRLISTYSTEMYRIRLPDHREDPGCTAP